MELPTNRFFYGLPANQHIIDGPKVTTALNPKAASRIGLRIDIHNKRALFSHGQGGPKIDRSSTLADTTLLISDRYNVRH